MVSINNYSLASFDFSFTTSSGDKIEIDMFDSIESNQKTNKNSYEFSLRHEYGYKFHYEGNGLDKNDLKEIKEALEKIKPLFKKFVEVKKKNEKLISNVANSIKNFLPKPKDDNHLNFIKDKTLDSIDEVIKKNQKKDDLKYMKMLFDKLFAKKFEIFA